MQPGARVHMQMKHAKFTNEKSRFASAARTRNPNQTLIYSTEFKFNGFRASPALFRMNYTSGVPALENVQWRGVPIEKNINALSVNQVLLSSFAITLNRLETAKNSILHMTFITIQFIIVIF